MVIIGNALLVMRAIFGWRGLTFRDLNKGLKNALFCNFLGFLSFFFLGGFSGMYFLMISATRNSLKLFKIFKKWMLILLIIIQILMTYFLNSESWWSILPLISGISSTAALFFCSNIKQLYYVNLFQKPLWLLYAWSLSFYSNMFIDCINTIIIIRTLCKMNQEEKKIREEDFKNIGNCKIAA